MTRRFLKIISILTVKPRSRTALAAITAVGALSAFQPQPAVAECPPAALQLLVLPGATVVYLDKSELGLSPGALQWTSALHGVVTDAGTRLAYSPNASYWDLGVDSIVVSTPGRNDQPKAVLWIAGTRHAQPSIEDFENPGNPNWDLGNFDPTAISTLGRLSGNYGLRFNTIDGGGSTSATMAQGPDGNGATAGGGATSGWQPPGGGGGSNGTCGEDGTLCPAGVWHRFLEGDGNDDGLIDHSVYFKENGNQVLVGLSEGASLPLSGEPQAVTTVSRQAHFLELIHWPSSEGRAAGAALWIDGGLKLQVATPGHGWAFADSLSAFTFREVPATYAPGMNDAAHSFDNLAVFRVTGSARFECLALDGFDNGAIDPVWTQYNAGNLSVHSGAALVGKQGLDVHLEDLGTNVGGLLRLLSAPSRGRHGLRLRFDPNTPEFTTGGTFNLVVGIQSESVPRPFVALMKRNTAGQLLLVFQTRDDGGGSKSTQIAITDAPHVLEIDWQRSSTVHAHTGTFRAWLDGTLVAEHLNVDSDAQSLNELRVGASGAPGAVKGHVFVDQVETWAETLPLAQ